MLNSPFCNINKAKVKFQWQEPPSSKVLSSSPLDSADLSISSIQREAVLYPRWKHLTTCLGWFGKFTSKSESSLRIPAIQSFRLLHSSKRSSDKILKRDSKIFKQIIIESAPISVKRLRFSLSRNFLVESCKAPQCDRVQSHKKSPKSHKLGSNQIPWVRRQMKRWSDRLEETKSLSTCKLTKKLTPSTWADQSQMCTLDFITHFKTNCLTLRINLSRPPSKKM